MEQTARIPNPVSGRIDEGYDTPPVTPLMIACRYGLAAWLPLYVLASAPFDLRPPLWLIVALGPALLVLGGVVGAAGMHIWSARRG